MSYIWRNVGKCTHIPPNIKRFLQDIDFMMSICREKRTVMQQNPTLACGSAFGKKGPLALPTASDRHATSPKMTRPM